MSLHSVEIPNSVKYIGHSAFASCNLMSIAIPNGVKYIEDFAFHDCMLKSITIPDSVKHIGKFAFTGLLSVNITFEGTLAKWAAISKDEKFIDGVKEYVIHCVDGDIANA